MARSILASVAAACVIASARALEPVGDIANAGRALEGRDRAEAEQRAGESICSPVKHAHLNADVESYDGGRTWTFSDFKVKLELNQNLRYRPEPNWLRAPTGTEVDVVGCWKPSGGWSRAEDCDKDQVQFDLRTEYEDGVEVTPKPASEWPFNRAPTFEVDGKTVDVHKFWVITFKLEVPGYCFTKHSFVYAVGPSGGEPRQIGNFIDYVYGNGKRRSEKCIPLRLKGEAVLSEKNGDKFVTNTFRARDSWSPKPRDWTPASTVRESQWVKLLESDDDATVRVDEPTRSFTGTADEQHLSVMGDGEWVYAVFDPQVRGFDYCKELGAFKFKYHDNGGRVYRPIGTDVVYYTRTKNLR